MIPENRKKPTKLSLTVNAESKRDAVNLGRMFKDILIKEMGFKGKDLKIEITLL